MTERGSTTQEGRRRDGQIPTDRQASQIPAPSGDASGNRDSCELCQADSPADLGSLLRQSKRPRVANAKANPELLSAASGTVGPCV